MVAAALQRFDGRWLMHKRPAHKQHGGLWEFPGGKVESGETPGNALLRELAEELGIVGRADRLRPSAFAEMAALHAHPATVILLYTLQGWEGEPRALERGAEIDWFLPAQIAALERPPLDIMLSVSLFGPEPAGESGG